MGTRMVRLDEDVYEHIKSRKQEDETFSETIERLTSEYSLLDFASDDPVVDPDRHRDVLEERDESSRRETKERLKRLDVAVDDEE